MPSTELPDDSLVTTAYRGLWLNLVGWDWERDRIQRIITSVESRTFA